MARKTGSGRSSRKTLRLTAPPASAPRRRASRRRKPPPRARRISRLRKPDGMSLEAWQIALRRQFAPEQNLRLSNAGSEPVFSEFHVTNPDTARTYRVAIRGECLGENYCSCPDYAVNTLGTCKHIEFTLGKLRRKRGGRAALRRGFQPAYSEVYLRYGAKREIVFKPGSACPEPLKRLAEAYFDAAGLLRPEAYGRFHLFLKNAGGGDHELRCYDDALAFVARVRSRAELARRIDRQFPGGADGRALAGLLKVPMFPYQRQGALFAARAGRCLIADDMGLGKTVEAMAAAEMLARAGAVERVLVICPTSLKHQWQREIERFSGRSAVVVEGLAPARAKAYAAEAFYKMTNYDVVRRDLPMIADWAPDLIVLDEAQRIKNWQTLTAKSVKQLDSDYTFVLTGTPLENRLEELHSIVEFVDRFRLGPMFRFLDAHQHLDESGRVVGYRNLAAISETLKPILIRRTKQEVLRELPERMEKRFFVPMTAEQMTHHEENREIVARIVAKWRRCGFLSEVDQHRLTCALQNMRMSCNSTYLLDGQTDCGVKADELMTLLGEILEQPQAKVVVFSQWVRMHELIAARLDRKKWRHVFFHGGVPGPKRKQLIDRFRGDESCRLFLSTDAGGVGLNLQNATAVIIMDQPWNPAVLEQRIGRVHRIGQRRPVRVVHFISQGTIEEGMLALLSFKKSMFSGVLDGGKDEVFLGGTRLKRFMDSVETATAGAAGAAPAAPEAPAAEPAATGVEGPAPRPPAAPKAAAGARSSQEQAWAEVLSAGVSLLDKLAQAVVAGKARPPAADAAAPPGPAGMIARDEKTNQPYLKLPLPPPETLSKIAEVLAAFAGQGAGG